MRLTKLSFAITLVAFSFNTLFSPLYAQPYYSTSVGGGAYCDCKKAPHLAATILLAGVFLGAVIAMIVKKPADPNGHSHAHGH